MSLAAPHKKIVLGNKALEMLMRDVLDGLEDFSLETIYHFPAGVVEVEEIIAGDPVVERRDNVVHVVPELARARRSTEAEDIIDYLMRNEFKS